MNTYSQKLSCVKKLFSVQMQYILITDKPNIIYYWALLEVLLKESDT